MLVHLVGTVNTGNLDFIAALDHPNIVYHGPLSERETLNLLETMDLAIMPHKTDPVSTYMNPLKVQMYAAVDLPAVSTDVPGIEPDELLTVAGSTEAFLEAVRQLADRRPPRQPRGNKSNRAAEYLAEIGTLRVAGAKG